MEAISSCNHDMGRFYYLAMFEVTLVRCSSWSSLRFWISSSSSSRDLRLPPSEPEILTGNVNEVE